MKSPSNINELYQFGHFFFVKMTITLILHLEKLATSIQNLR